MSRTTRAGLAIAAALFVVFGSRGPAFRTDRGAEKPDSVWYHASDVAQLAKTGRPQLVEFFHPD
jgi:hypothetical protein